MKKNYFFKSVVFLATILTVFACKKTSTPSPQLTVSASTIAFAPDGGSQDVTITSNADWTVSNPALSWLQISTTSGKSGTTVIHVAAASANGTGATQSVILTISASNGQARRITVSQAPTIYPSYNTSPIPADATGMGSTATQLAANMTMGWNIFNTMEASGGETGWGNPPITQQLIDLIKSKDFNAIRIPIQYTDHLVNRSTARIDPVWLARIKAVVQYCFNDNMYVIVNIHYDPGSKLVGAPQDSADARHRAYWEQAATTLRDFDEHLLFASANEPDANDKASTITLMRYHQTFINAVRSTGGRNAYRTLVIQAPSTSIDLANLYLDPANIDKSTALPTDPVPHKMMVEFHYYSPSQFTILGGYDTVAQDAGWGKELYFWGKNFHTTNPKFLDRNCSANSEEHYMDSIFKTVKTRFADKGIPLVMGEYQPNYHASKLLHYPTDMQLALNSAGHYHAYVTESAKANGVIPFLWAGIFDRPAHNGVPTGPAVIGDQMALDSVQAGVNKGVVRYGSGGHF